jgi:hypothetical protein
VIILRSWVSYHCRVHEARGVSGGGCFNHGGNVSLRLLVLAKNGHFLFLSRCIKAGSCPTCNALLNLLSRLDTPLYTEGLEERFWQVRSTAERVVYAEHMESPP